MVKVISLVLTILVLAGCTYTPDKIENDKSLRSAYEHDRDWREIKNPCVKVAYGWSDTRFAQIFIVCDDGHLFTIGFY